MQTLHDAPPLQPAEVVHHAVSAFAFILRITKQVEKMAVFDVVLNKL